MKILNNVTTPKQLESTNEVLAPIITASAAKVTDLHADILDSFHADAGMVANTIPVRGSDAKIPGSITGDANTVDGKHATDFATAGHTHTYIKFADTRSAASSPADYTAELEANLKQNAIIGLSETGTYAKVLGISGWTDDSAGSTHELAFGDSGNIFLRSGTRAAGWNAWQKLWHSGNDGHGSTLDSDTLDTLHAADFARAVHTHVATDVIEDTTHRFITDDERSLWELAVGGAGEIYADGTYIGMRRRLNFISGNNTTLSATENSVTGQIDITVAETFTYSHPATHPASMITGLATVATSGSYLDLSNKPSSSVANIDDAVTKRHTQNTDTGTTSVTFQVGSTGSGPKLKNVGGALEIRNAADSGYADIVVNNVTIMGTTTTINSETLTVADNQILLNSNYVGSAPIESAGVAVNRGTLTQASLIWDESSDLWKAGLLGSETALSLVGHTHVSTNITDFHEAAEDVIATTIADSATINFTYDDVAGTITGAVNDNTSIQKQEFEVGSVLKGTRKRLNLIAGSNMSISGVDDATNDKVNVTVGLPATIVDAGVQFTIAAGSTSKGLTWTGVTDSYTIFAEETSGGETTHLIIKSSDNDTDSVLFRHSLSAGTTIDEFEVTRAATISYVNLDARAGLDLTGAMTINDANTQILEGALNSVRIQTNSGYIDIGPQNTGWAHFATDRPNFHFAKPVYVAGEIYAGAAYDKQVWHTGNFTPATKLNIAGGAMTGMLEVANLAGTSWSENLRLPKSTAGWTTIAMGCAPGTTGTGDGIWSIHTDPNKNFLICHNGSSSPTGLFLGYDGSIKWKDQTVWHSGNFNPADKSDIGHIHSTIVTGLNEITMGSSTWTVNHGETNIAGAVHTSGTGSSRFMFHSDGGSTNVYVDGTVYVGEGASPVWHSGNFNPATKLNLTGGVMSGDLSIVKNNAWLTLQSSSSGGNGVEQGAGISIGESGYKGAAALHLTYTGDGYGFIGMGAVNTTTGLPTYPAMSMYYQDQTVRFYTTPTVAGNAVWHAGNLTPVAQTSVNRPGTTKLFRRDDDSNYNVQTNWLSTFDGYRWQLYGYTGDTAHAGCYVQSAENANTVDGAHAYDFAMQVADAGDLTLRLPKSGFYEHSSATLAEHYPAETGTWMHIINCQHSNQANNFAMQLVAPFYSQDLYFRSTDGGGTTAWSEVLMAQPTANAAGKFDRSTTAPTGTNRLNYSGYLYATRLYGAVYNDYAEYCEKGDDTLEPGDIVIINPDDEENYIKSRFAYDELTVGVYSDDYAQCIGGKGDGNDEEGYASVGMAGKARVKVTGKVRKGDKIVASDIPGVGMAASEYRPGTVVGKALQSHDGDGIDRIKILIVNM